MEKKTKSRHVDFLVVGAAKAGTSSLYHYLKKHPQVFLTEQKELLFWHLISNPNKTQADYMNFWINDIKEYTKLFEGAKANQICGDITPSYLYYYDHVINNLKRHHPQWEKIKIIIILREPVDKVISHYKFLQSKIGADEKSLEYTLSKEKNRLKNNNILPDYYLIDNTMYYKQVKAYIDNFPNIKIVLYDDLKKDTNEFMNSICQFLNIEPVSQQAELKKVYNKSTVRTVPKNTLIYYWLKLNTRYGISRNLKKIFKIKIKLIPPGKLSKEEEISEKTKRKLKMTFFEDVHKLQGLLDFDILQRWEYHLKK